MKKELKLNNQLKQLKASSSEPSKKKLKMELRLKRELVEVTEDLECGLFYTEFKDPNLKKEAKELLHGLKRARDVNLDSDTDPDAGAGANAAATAETEGTNEKKKNKRGQTPDRYINLTNSSP